MSGVAKLGFNERKSSVGTGLFLTGERAQKSPNGMSHGHKRGYPPKTAVDFRFEQVSRDFEAEIWRYYEFKTQNEN